MELLLLFDAQCRCQPGTTVRNVRTVQPKADERHESWQQLVLTEGSSEHRPAEHLRARQIRKAFTALEQRHHLIQVGIAKQGRARRNFDDITLLAENSTPDKKPRYTVPAEHDNLVRIPRHFFTNLWLFALTDTELAIFLALSWTRSANTFSDPDQGVFVPRTNRHHRFGLKPDAWRSARRLHEFRLIDQHTDPGREFRTGRVPDFPTRWKQREVMPARFTIVDAALESPAIDTIHQILTDPSESDQARKDNNEWILPFLNQNR